MRSAGVVVRASPKVGRCSFMTFASNLYDTLIPPPSLPSRFFTLICPFLSQNHIQVYRVCSMSFELGQEQRLDKLHVRLCRARVVTAELLTDVIAAVCTR